MTSTTESAQYLTSCNSIIEALTDALDSIYYLPATEKQVRAASAVRYAQILLIAAKQEIEELAAAS